MAETSPDAPPKRHTLDARYDDIKNGKVKMIPGGPARESCNSGSRGQRAKQQESQ